MIKYFCTYFDKNYLIRGLAMYNSLRKYCPEFYLWILCMDKETYDMLSGMELSGAALIAIEDFESKDEELLKAKKNRSQIEYYFTCTPSLPLYVLRNFSEVDLITYIDADLYFFSNPDVIYDEIKSNSIAIVRHNFSSWDKISSVAGIYNVSWISFRRDENGLSCLSWWRKACNERCLDRVEDGRFADQKYLDDWPERFKNVIIMQNKGINVAPWNVGNYNIRINKDIIWIDEQSLVFFHFHGFKHLIWRFYYTGISYYKVKVDSKIRDFIYRPYLSMLLDVRRGLLSRGVDYNLLGSIRASNCAGIYKKMKRFLSAIYNMIVFKDYVFITENYMYAEDK